MTARYRDSENAEIVMSLVGDFCRSKGKEATLYKTTASNTSTIQEVWACQTPPMLNDTDILSAVYCHFIANAPRYSVDFSNRQKEVAEQKFVTAFLKKRSNTLSAVFTISTRVTLLLGLWPNMMKASALIKSASGLTSIASRQHADAVAPPIVIPSMGNKALLSKIC